MVGLGRHLDRMRGSLQGVGIGFDPAGLERSTYELLAANRMADAFIYWQVTRGTPGPADPPRTRIPRPGMTPTVFGYCSPQPPLAAFEAPPRRSAVTLEDIRWLMGHIKTTSLLGNVMLTMAADAAGGEDAVFVRGGLVAEGTATNVMLAVRGAGGRTEVVTPSLDSVPILAGVTRAILLAAAPGIVERPVWAWELREASEVMLVGTTTMVTSVVRLDGRPVGGGEPGPEAQRLLAALLAAIRKEGGG